MKAKRRISPRLERLEGRDVPSVVAIGPTFTMPQPVGATNFFSNVGGSAASPTMIRAHIRWHGTAVRSGAWPIRGTHHTSFGNPFIPSIQLAAAQFAAAPLDPPPVVHSGMNFFQNGFNYGFFGNGGFRD